MALFGSTRIEGNALNIREIFRNIESHDLSAELNMALNLSNFFRIADEQESIQNLKLLINDLENINIILLRIKDLIEEKVDLRYENPYDTAVTVYTWALFSGHTQAGKIAAEYATSLRQGWWAIKYARDILNEARHSISTGQVDVIPDAPATIKVDEAGEVLIYFTPSANLIKGIQWYLGGPQGTFISNLQNPWKDNPKIGFKFGSIDVKPWPLTSWVIPQKPAFNYYPPRVLVGQQIALLPEHN